jgi:hypothetical protein
VPEALDGGPLPLGLAKPANEVANDMERDALIGHLAHGECLLALTACRFCRRAGFGELVPPEKVVKANPE